MRKPRITLQEFLAKKSIVTLVLNDYDYKTLIDSLTRLSIDVLTKNPKTPKVKLFTYKDDKKGITYISNNPFQKDNGVVNIQNKYTLKNIILF